MTTPGDSEFARLEKELARVSRENGRLNEQVRLLVQTERRLSNLRRTSEREMQQLEALLDLSNRHRTTSGASSVVGSCAVFLRTQFNLQSVIVLSARANQSVLRFHAKRSHGVDPRHVGSLTKQAQRDLLAWLRGHQRRVQITTVGMGAPGFEREIPASVLNALGHASGEQAKATLGDTLGVLQLHHKDARVHRWILFFQARGHRRSHFKPVPTTTHEPVLRLLSVVAARTLENMESSIALQQERIKLAHSNSTLEQALTDLSDTQAQLLRSAKLEAIGRLAGGVAHDFNNLLTLILGYGSQLKRRLEGKDTESRWIGEIVDAGERAAALTQQLMAFGRAHDVVLRQVDVNEVIQAMASMLQRLLGEDSQLHLNLSDAPHWIRSDQVRLEQVILNLVVNARDAMPHGGQVSISTTAEIQPDDSAWCVLRVSDTGTGMDPETQEHVFEPFFTTKDVGDGSGMGLSIVYGVVSQCGGEISVSSTPGIGSTFEIRFPLTGEGAASSPDKADDPMLPHPGARVLVVEDDPAIRDLCCTVLRGAGYHVIEVEQPGKVLDLADSVIASLDLMLLDVVMPEMAGTDLAELVRLRHPGIDVLFMSGHTRGKLSRLTAGSRATRLLRKPFVPDELLRSVAECLDKRNPVLAPEE